MTDFHRQQIARLREDGYSYDKIAKALGLSENTVKSYCRRNYLSGFRGKRKVVEEHFCKMCGLPVKQNPHRKEKKFCSSTCRQAWWGLHQDLVGRKVNYAYECANCGTKFESWDARRKYCCLECYFDHRFPDSKERRRGKMKNSR